MAITLGGGVLGDLEAPLAILQLGGADPGLSLAPALAPTLLSPAN